MSKPAKPSANPQTPAIQRWAGRIAARTGIVDRSFHHKFLQPRRFLAHQRPQAQDFKVVPPSVTGLYRQFQQRYQPLAARITRRARPAEPAKWQPLDMALPTAGAPTVGGGDPMAAPALPQAPLPNLLGLPGQAAPRPQAAPSAPAGPVAPVGQIIPRKEDDPDWAPNRAARQPVPQPSKRPVVPASHRLFSRVEEVQPGKRPASPAGPDSPAGSTPPAGPALNPPVETPQPRPHPTPEPKTAPAETPRPSHASPATGAKGTVQRSVEPTGPAARIDPAPAKLHPTVQRAAPTGPAPAQPPRLPPSPVDVAPRPSAMEAPQSAPPAAAEPPVRVPITTPGAGKAASAPAPQRMAARAVVQREPATAAPRPTAPAKPRAPHAARIPAPRFLSRRLLSRRQPQPVTHPSAEPAPAQPARREEPTVHPLASALPAQAPTLAPLDRPEAPQAATPRTITRIAARPAAKPQTAQPRPTPPAGTALPLSAPSLLPRPSTQDASEPLVDLTTRRVSPAASLAAPQAGRLSIQVAPARASGRAARSRLAPLRARAAGRPALAARGKPPAKTGIVQRESLPQGKEAAPHAAPASLPHAVPVSQPHAAPVSRPAALRPARMAARPRASQPAGQTRSSAAATPVVGGALLPTPTGPRAVPAPGAPLPHSPATGAAPAAFASLTMPVVAPARPAAQPNEPAGSVQRAESGNTPRPSPVQRATLTGEPARAHAGIVQRQLEDDDEPITLPDSSPTAAPSGAVPQPSGAGAEAEEQALDFDQIARQVYPVILRKLRAERERQAGRIR